MDEILALASDRQTTTGLILIVAGILLMLNAIGIFKFSAVFFTRDMDTILAFAIFGVGMATLYNE